MHFQTISSLILVACLSLGIAEPVVDSSDSALLAPRLHARDIQPMKQGPLLPARASVPGPSGSGRPGSAQSDGQKSDSSASSHASASQAAMNKVVVADKKNARTLGVNGCTSIFLFSPSTKTIVCAHIDPTQIVTVAKKARDDAAKAKAHVTKIKIIAPVKEDRDDAKAELKILYPNIVPDAVLYDYEKENEKAGKEGQMAVFQFEASLNGDAYTITNKTEYL